MRGDVVVQDRGLQCTEFAAGRGETVGSGTHGGGLHFGCDEEGDGVGAELIEERREEGYGLEFADVLGGGVVFEVEAGNGEEDEVHQEADHLHVFAAVELVVNEEGWKRLFVSGRSGKERLEHERRLTGKIVSG